MSVPVSGNWEAYKRHLSFVKLEGYLDEADDDSPTEKGRTRTWKQYWYVLQKGCLLSFKSADERHMMDLENLPLSPKAGGRTMQAVGLDSVRKMLPLEHVNVVKTAREFGENCMQLRMDGAAIVLRTKSREERDKWLFAFQRSIATIVNMLVLRGQEQTRHRGAMDDLDVSGVSISKPLIKPRSVSRDAYDTAMNDPSISSSDAAQPRARALYRKLTKLPTKAAASKAGSDAGKAGSDARTSGAATAPRALVRKAAIIVEESTGKDPPAPSAPSAPAVTEAPARQPKQRQRYIPPAQRRRMQQQQQQQQNQQNQELLRDRWGT